MNTVRCGKDLTTLSVKALPWAKMRKARCKSATTAITVKVGMPVGRNSDKIPWALEGIPGADGLWGNFEILQMGEVCSSARFADSTVWPLLCPFQPLSFQKLKGFL